MSSRGCDLIPSILHNGNCTRISILMPRMHRRELTPRQKWFHHLEIVELLIKPMHKREKLKLYKVVRFPLVCPKTLWR